MSHNPSVLVVDDSADNREMLAEYLTFRGFTVVTASDGAEALARAEELRPQVVLMDLGLPGPMDGWEATRRFKLHPVLKHTVVFAVTAHGFPVDQQRAMHAGCQAVFVKPYNLPALAARVQDVVAAHTRSLEA
jgi:two-component system, cell cycle response regulator DivK